MCITLKPSYIYVLWIIVWFFMYVLFYMYFNKRQRITAVEVAATTSHMDL